MKSHAALGMTHFSLLNLSIIQGRDHLKGKNYKSKLGTQVKPLYTEKESPSITKIHKIGFFLINNPPETSIYCFYILLDFISYLL